MTCSENESGLPCLVYVGKDDHKMDSRKELNRINSFGWKIRYQKEAEKN